MSLHHQLRDYWRAEGVKPCGGADLASIAAFEDKYEVAVPSDLREFLVEFNGTADMAGRDYFRFLQLNDYAPSDGSCQMQFGKAYSDAYPAMPNGFFVFADYLQWCYGYAINLSKDSVNNSVILIGGLTCPVVANSFTSFMELYLQDSPNIHPKASD